MLSCSTVMSLRTSVRSVVRAVVSARKISPQLAKTGVNLLHACSQIVEFGIAPSCPSRRSRRR